MDDLFIQAFQLLDDWEEHSLTESPGWIATTRTKVDAAISSLAANGSNDEEIGIEILRVVNGRRDLENIFDS